jgi:hypothetical protein
MKLAAVRLRQAFGVFQTIRVFFRPFDLLTDRSGRITIPKDLEISGTPQTTIPSSETANQSGNCDAAAAP